jgi:hypothetical protein
VDAGRFREAFDLLDALLGLDERTMYHQRRYDIGDDVTAAYVDGLFEQIESERRACCTARAG